ncbi:MAG: ImmA/IrrE family metallo-endopeptidase [Bacteroidetes bacterium]|nr:ImmA/IrrE family metallo-endopeptidase [Bacteroidota bacterium]
MSDPLAAAYARKVIEEYCIKYPGQYSIQQIINARGLTYREALLSGSIGNIIFNGTSGTVTVSSSLGETSQKVFTAAHELGHFENEKIKFKSCSFEEVSGLSRTSPREMSANDFAAELLMHEKWFVEYVRGKKLESRMLKETANYFNVSLSAASIRYAEIGAHPAAVIMSKDGLVKWSSINKSFPIQFIRWGEKVSDLSYTSDFFKGDTIPSEAEDVPARAWFKESFYIKDSDRVFEFNIPFKNYNSILTVLYF